MNRRLCSLLAMPALVLLLASCGSGGGGSSDEAKPYVDAMTKSMTADKDSPLDKKQARCFSEGFVDVVGIEKIKKAGTAKEFADKSEDLEFKELDLTRDQGKKIYAKFDECGVDLRAALLKEVLAEEDIPAETKSCVEKALNDEGVEDFFITMMVSGEDAAQAEMTSGKLMKALTTCMLGDVGGDK